MWYPGRSNQFQQPNNPQKICKVFNSTKDTQLNTKISQIKKHNWYSSYTASQTNYKIQNN